jgi:hypothetical protein
MDDIKFSGTPTGDPERRTMRSLEYYGLLKVSDVDAAGVHRRPGYVIMRVMNDTPHTPTTLEVLDARLLWVSRRLVDDGYYDDQLELYLKWHNDRWRLLTELLELMAISGYDEGTINHYRTLERR